MGGHIQVSAVETNSNVVGQSETVLKGVNVSTFRDGWKQRRIALELLVTWEIPGQGESYALLVHVSLGAACLRIAGQFAPPRPARPSCFCVRHRLQSFPALSGCGGSGKRAVETIVELVTIWNRAVCPRMPLSLTLER